MRIYIQYSALQRGEQKPNIQLRMISDSKQRLWLSRVCCSRLAKVGGSRSAKALTTSTRGITVQVVVTIKGFLQILRISTEDVLYSAMFVYSHE